MRRFFRCCLVVLTACLLLSLGFIGAQMTRGSDAIKNNLDILETKIKDTFVDVTLTDKDLKNLGLTDKEIREVFK